MATGRAGRSLFRKEIEGILLEKVLLLSKWKRTDSRGDILGIEKDVDGASRVGRGRDAVDE